MPVELRADLHTHTRYSDGRGYPEDNVEHALKRGLSVLAITDHDTFKGALRAREYVMGKSLGDRLILVIGNEVRTDKGDVLVLCMDYPGNDVPRDVLSLIDWAHSNNCLTVPAHPFDVFRHGLGNEILRYKWDAVEVFNSGALPLANKVAFNMARKMGLTGLANSDAHIPELVGIAYTRIYVNSPNIEEAFKAIVGGNVAINPGYPGPSLLLKRISWSLERRLRAM